MCLFWARDKEHHDCLNSLLEKGCPEPTDEDYAWFVERCDWFVEQKRLTTQIERNTWRETSSNAFFNNLFYGFFFLLSSKIFGGGDTTDDIDSFSNSFEEEEEL